MIARMARIIRALNSSSAPDFQFMADLRILAGEAFDYWKL